MERSVDEDWMRSQGTIIRHQMGRMRKEAAVLKALVRVMQTHQRRMVRSCIRVIRENGSGQPGTYIHQHHCCFVYLSESP